MAAFRLGFLAHLPGRAAHSADRKKELLEVFAAAEEFGFDGGWLAQRHVQPDFGRLPPPLAFFGAAAARTTRLRLGAALTVLPLQDPARLAEDVTALDALSDNRLELGLSTVDADGGALFDGQLATFRSTGKARGRSAEQTHTLAKRLWQRASDPDRAELIGRAQDGLLLDRESSDPRSARRLLAEAYLAGWQAVRATGTPRFGIVCDAFPAHNRRIALSTGDDPLLDLLTPESWLLPVVQHGRADHGSVVDRLSVIATEVAPALGWRKQAAA